METEALRFTFAWVALGGLWTRFGLALVSSVDETSTRHCCCLAALIQSHASSAVSSLRVGSASTSRRVLSVHARMLGWMISRLLRIIFNNDEVVPAPGCDRSFRSMCPSFSRTEIAVPRGTESSSFSVVLPSIGLRVLVMYNCSMMPRNLSDCAVRCDPLSLQLLRVVSWSDMSAN